MPQVRDLDELNAQLLARCATDLERRVRGSAATMAILLVEDRAAFVPLPAVPFDACVKRSTAADSLSLVRFDDNDYSVPVRYAHHPVVVRAYVDRVVLAHKGEVIAEHGRRWGREGVAFDPVQKSLGSWGDEGGDRHAQHGPDELRRHPLDVMTPLEDRYVLIEVALVDPAERPQEVA